MKLLCMMPDISLETHPTKKLSILFLIFRLANTTNAIMSFSLFSDLLTCALVIAFNLLLLDSTDHMDLRIATSLYNMATITSLTLVFCLASESITEALFGVGDAFYESPWYCLPIQHQKQLILIIARSQRELRLEGLGLIFCSLETFGRVIFQIQKFSYDLTIICNLFRSIDYKSSFFILFDDPKRQMICKMCG